ncbi:MAG: hypothetical protein A4E73_01249 [Syntrophaceae bacterium PtaU1.Bin231]|nr:MAG: hypothetical protein A4E73_01249 [Syntrophaceae bacterium PtaU1.Bin231]HOG16976.1 hypothetical protein [Syntrophales bacterium]
MSSRIRILAGKRIYPLLRDGGFDWGSIAAYFAPAVGPRWLISCGFDRALLREGVLKRKRAPLLVGASAGAWRLAAWLQPEALKSYRILMESYIDTVYSRRDTPASILASLWRIVDSYIENDALPFALANKNYRLAVITARTRHLVAAENGILQRLGLGFCFAANAFNRSLLRYFAERVVFFHGALPPYFCLQRGFRGRHIPLSAANFKAAVVASGAIPLVVAGVRNIYGAPYGTYRDGGLVDYHLTHRYSRQDDEITLFFHHQERIVPGWLDKKLSHRRVPEDVLGNVLMITPTPGFVQSLPDGKIPDRDDFRTYVNRPSERIRKWRAAVEIAAPLGEVFLDLVESRRLGKLVEPLTGG